MGSKNGVVVNFYVDGIFETTTPLRQKMIITQATEYPRNGKIVLRLDIEKPELFDVKLRIPEWSKVSTISVNGEAINEVTSGQYKELKRNWKKGDLIEINLDMGTRLQTSGKQPVYVALMRGPILFARDTRLGGPELAAVLKPVGSVKLIDTISGKADIWMEAKALFAPEAYPAEREKPIEVSFCDYASAGNGAAPSYFLVWMPQLVDARVKL